VCVGIITSVLHDFCANEIQQPITRDMAHLAGIVHDMGKILFERYANKEFHQAIKSAEVSDLPVLKEECRLLGMGHDEAGAWLGEKWKLGDGIQMVLRWHHNPYECPRADLQPLVKLVHMADYICHNQSLGTSGNPSPNYDHRIREELHLTPERIGELMDIVNVEAAHSDVLLSLTES